MVELGFGGSIGLGFNGGDVRSVIKNATKDVNMSESKDKTIVNKDELNSKKIDKKINQEKPKVTPFNGGIPGVGNLTGGSLGGINNNGVDLNQYRGNKVEGNTTRQDATKTDEVKTDSKKSSPVNLFGNNFTGIDGLTKNVSGIEGTMVTPEQMQKQREQINLRKEQTATALSAFDDFVESINGSIRRGEEDRLTIENIRRAFPEFESLDEKQIYDLVRGVYNANKLGNEYSLYDFAVKHPELYIEFNSGKDLGMNGKADLLEAMFSPESGTYDRKGLLNILTAGLAPNELGTLEGVSLDDVEAGKEGRTFLQNAYKSLWNAVALTYNFINHPGESLKGLGNMILSFGTSRALKKAAEDAGVSRDEWINMLIDEMGDGTSFKDKITKWMINSGNMGEMTRDYFRTTYGTADGFANYIYTDPAGVLSDIVSLVEAGVGLAGKAGLIEKASMKSAMKTLSWLDPYQAPGKVLMGSDDVIKIGGKQIKNVGIIPELAKIEGKAAKGVLKTTGKVSKRVMEFVANKMTGLSEESRKFIKENPDLAMSYIKGEMGAEDIIEKIQKEFNDIVGEKKKVGEFYEFMKNNENVSVKTSGIVSEVKGMLKDLGIKINKSGNLEFGKLSYTPAQQRQLQQVYGYINALQDLGDNASVKDVWRARQLIDGLANWEGNSKMGLDAEVMNSIRSMRGKVDDALKEQVKGFKEADTEYKALLTSIKELKRDWFNKDGTVKDNIGSKVRNLTNRANEKKLERLEKYIPDIRENAQALGVAEAVDKATKLNVGQYLQQGLMGGGLYALLSGNITGKAIFSFLGVLGVTTPKNFVRVLAKIGKGEEWVKNVGDKIMNGLKLSKEQEDSVIKLLDRNKEEIMANPEKYIDLIEEGEYAKGQNKAYLGAESTERKLSKEERASLLKKYAKGSKNNGFVMDVVKNMGDGTHGMADLDRKLIKLEENFGDTTAQHEFFHALFSVVDDNTKNYVLKEVKNYLGLTDEKYSKLPKEKAEEIMNKAAEEWLAESFGVYARRKEIKLGEIRLKGNRLQRFGSRVKDLFQRAYEWIQNYSMDKKTINKLFNEVYGAVDGKVLDESGKFNLAEKLGINEKTPKLGVNENGLRYKKGGNLGKNDYKDTAVKAQHDVSFEKKTPLTAVRGQNFNDSGLFGGNKDGKGNYIVKGGKNEQVIYTKVNKNGKAKFSGYKMELQEKNRKYYDNVVDALNRFEKKGYNGKDILIGKTPRGNDIFITDKDLVHIFKEHGEFYIENLIESVNDGRDGFWETKANKRYGEGALGLRPRMEIEIPGKNEKFIVGLMSDGSDEFNSTRYNVKSLRESKPSQVESRGGVRFKKDEKGLDVKDKQDGKIRYKRVRHGSPTEFQKFDSSHMGEGEGAQAHGWGHYVAVDEKTGRHYAEMMDSLNLLLDGKKKEDFAKAYSKYGKSEDLVKGKIAQGLEWGWDLETAKHQVKLEFENYLKNIQGTETTMDGQKYIHSPNGLYPKDAREKTKKLYEGYIDEVDKITEKNMTNQNVGKRNLYEVEIPDEVKKNTPTGINYLEEGSNNTIPGWEKGIIKPEQVDKFVDALKNYDEVAGQKLADMMYYKSDVAPSMVGREMYKTLTKVLGGEKEASKFLEKIGYDGIHYYGGIDGESYVIFNDKTPEIEKHIRYKKDSAGKELSQAQQDFFKDSKVRDKSGKLLRMYHGTPDKGFTVFKEGYFTPNKEYADKYQSTTASSIKFNKKGANPGTYEVYLNIKNPFDTRDAKAREIFEKEYFGNYGMGTQLGEKGLPDWMDGTDLQEFLMEKHPEYDGLILDEGGTFIPNTSKYENDFYGGEVQDRGLSYVPFESNQIKNVDNLNPTKSEDIRYKKDANEGQGLIAIHNTSMEKLAKSKNLGGIVAPSVAITKEGVPFENYGEISFIGNKDLVKPGKNTVVGETDLYSPRVPKPTLERKDGVTREMRDEFAEKMGMRESELESYLYDGGGTYWEGKYPKLAEEIEPLINKSLFKGFTDMGDRIYEPYTMKNIIKEMFSEGDIGTESSMFQGSLSEAMARMSDEVTDFEKVRGKIVDGGYDMKKLDEKYDKLSEKYSNYGWDVLESREGMGIFTENIKRSNSAIVAELADYGIDVTEKQVQKLKDMVKEGLDLPKGYVEAKIKRGVGFDEFSAVVVPEDKVAEVKKLIDNPNVEVYGYKEGERMKVIQEVAKKNNLRFKKGLNKKLGSVGVMNSKGNIGGLNRKGLGTMAKGLRYKQQQDLKN